MKRSAQKSLAVKNCAGVWMDNQQALIVRIKGKKESFTIVESDLGSKHVKGGSRFFSPYRPQDVVSESKILERREHHFNQYHDQIMSHIKGSNRILLIGPNGAKKKFHQDLLSNYYFKGICIATETTDKMTKNQIRAKIRDFFRNKDI